MSLFSLIFLFIDNALNLAADRCEIIGKNAQHHRAKCAVKRAWRREKRHNPDLAPYTAEEYADHFYEALEQDYWHCTKGLIQHKNLYTPLRKTSFFWLAIVIITLCIIQIPYASLFESLMLLKTIGTMLFLLCVASHIENYHVEKYNLRGE